METIQIKRIDKSLPLPRFETAGAVGFDLLARTDTYVYQHTPSLIPANVVVKIPRGYLLMITLRSSTPRKFGLIMPHGVGIIDQDYCGNDDEIMIQVQRLTEGETVVRRGDRIAQGIFVMAQNYFKWTEVSKITKRSRGGFGSTDSE